MNNKAEYLDERFKEWNDAIAEYDCAKSVFNNSVIGPQIDIAIAMMKNCEDRLDIMKTRIGLIGDLNQLNYGNRDPFEYEFVEDKTKLEELLSKIKGLEALYGKIKIWLTKEK